jgi:hypothetical protein
VLTFHLKLSAIHDVNCELPVFEGIFPEEDDEQIQKLIWDRLVFHGYAKLRMRTDSTMETMESALLDLGNSLRHIVEAACPNFDTRELPREHRARIEHQKRSSGTKQYQVKKYSPSTAKTHALEDHMQTIRERGALDGLSTLLMEVLAYMQC